MFKTLLQAGDFRENDGNHKNDKDISDSHKHPKDPAVLNSLRARGTLISEPRKGRFPFLAWEKSHLAGG